MRRVLILVVSAALIAPTAAAQTADGLIAKYLAAIGGAQRVQSIQSLRRSGRQLQSGGREVDVVHESVRPNLLRVETTRGGLTGMRAYDGKTGWKLEPWRGRRDPEPLSEDELKATIDEADFDGALVDPARKGIRVESLGADQFEGTDVFKLRATTPQGAVFTYYLDAESYVPIKIDTRRMIRGEAREFETLLGDYKPAAGWMLPFWIEVGEKGSEIRRQTVYDKIEPNVTIAADRFRMPTPAGSPEPRSRAR